MATSTRFFATCARALEPLLAGELRALGASEVEERRAGVAFSGTLGTAYAACLWSRVASRVLLPIAAFAAPDDRALYDGVRAISWREHLGVRETLAVDFTSVRSQLAHTHYGALKTKDAIVDRLRDELGDRPSINAENPDVRVHVHVEDDQAEVALDLSGESLHRRGYRARGVEAPLKESLAAAVLLYADWPARAKERAPLVDPMCGSGTLLIEAALLAADVAPGLLRQRFGFHGWRGHRPELWRPLLAEARARKEAIDRRTLPPIVGSDVDPRAVRAALENARRAGFEREIQIEPRALDAATPPDSAATSAPTSEVRGLLVTNPPYGERLGEKEELRPLYALLGDRLRHHFPGFVAFVLTSDPELAGSIGLRAKRRHILYNGALECRLLELPIATAAPKTGEGPGWRRPRAHVLGAGAEMFRNRLAKNLRHLRKWARRENVACFRVYDADLPEYAVAVDLYEDAAHISEYEAPKTVDPEAAEARLHDVMAVAPEVLGVSPDQVFLKVRRRQRGLAQYEKLDASGAERTIHEGGHTFLVNLRDYLDTGLFLDHRSLRALVAELAPGRRFLNLFAYTATATVYAAKAGARATVSVDLSNTYLDWARRNFEANGVRGPAHELVRADVTAWLPSAPNKNDRFGLILCAPPTFSTSKKMEETFDVQRDHVALLRDCAARLEPDGVLLFSNHFRRFKLDRNALPELAIEEITAQTRPPDFARNPRIHNSWRITLR